MGTKRKEEYSHKSWIKILSIASTIFILGNLAWNGYIMYAGFQLNWGFYPDRFQPSFIPTFNATGENETQIDIPIYVYNNGSVGFPIEDLRIDIVLKNETDVMMNSSNDLGNIPFGTGGTYNVSVVKLYAEDLLNLLNATSTPLTFDIFFNVKYISTTVTLDVSINLPTGGLNFTS